MPHLARPNSDLVVMNKVICSKCHQEYGPIYHNDESSNNLMTKWVSPNTSSSPWSEVNRMPCVGKVLGAKAITEEYGDKGGKQRADECNRQ
jgi:hypothetical protein